MKLLEEGMLPRRDGHMTLVERYLEPIVASPPHCLSHHRVLCTLAFRISVTHVSDLCLTALSAHHG